jgi:hypothetical protein
MIGYVHNISTSVCNVHLISTCGRVRPTPKRALVVFERLHRACMRYIINDLVDPPLEIRLTRCHDNVQTHRHYIRNLALINYAPHLAEIIAVCVKYPSKIPS